MSGSRFKVVTVIGTRPEIIKLSRVITVLNQHVEHTLVHTGQNFDYELNEIFFRDLELKKPDVFLDAVGETLAETIGNVITRLDRVLSEIQPDAFLVLGDTNSCLGVIPAKRRKIPIFHMEAGNRCFDQRVPEEVNRKIVDHTSDINMTFTEHARRYLIAEGIRPETIIKTGSPTHEVLVHAMPKIEASDIVSRLGLTPGAYFVVSAHREENIEDPNHFRNFLATLTALAARYQQPVIVTTHPRTRKQLDALGVAISPLVQFLKPLGFFDYVQLQRGARCVVSDSGTITEEATILNLPAVTIRDAHERPEGMDEGTLIMSGLEPEHVLRCVEIVMSQHRAGERRFRRIPDYAPENVSEKVLRIIMSYTQYVNRVVWRKSL